MGRKPNTHDARPDGPQNCQQAAQLFQPQLAPGQYAKLTRPVPIHSGDLPVGTTVKLLDVWRHDGGMLANVVCRDGRQVCSLPAEAMRPVQLKNRCTQSADR